MPQGKAGRSPHIIGNLRYDRKVCHAIGHPVAKNYSFYRFVKKYICLSKI